MNVAATEMPWLARGSPVSTQSKFKVIRGTPSSADEAIVNRNEQIRASAKLIIRAASQDCWDGAGTLKVSDYSVNNLYKVIEKLPAALPVPEISVTPKGSISFDWDENSDCQFSVLIQDQNRIGFSYYIAGDRLHGSASFSNEKLSDELLAAAKKWIQKNKS